MENTTNISLLPSYNFTFNGRSSEDFGLRIYFLDNTATQDKPLWTSTIIEDRLPSKTYPLFYRLDTNRGLQYTVVIGGDKYLSAEQVDEVAHWLTSPQSYKWLKFDRPDLKAYNYRVIVTELTQVSVNDLPVAFKVTFTTDSQYAYEDKKHFVFEYDPADSESKAHSEIGIIENTSSYEGFIYPHIKITLQPRFEQFSIRNDSDDGREFIFSEFPIASATIASQFDKLKHDYDEAVGAYNELLEQYNKYMAALSEYAPIDDKYTGQYRVKSSDMIYSKEKFDELVLYATRNIVDDEISKIKKDVHLSSIDETFITQIEQVFNTMPDDEFHVILDEEQAPELTFFPSVDAPEYIKDKLAVAAMPDYSIYVTNSNASLLPLIRYYCVIERDRNAPRIEGLKEFFYNLAKANFLKLLKDFIPVRHKTQLALNAVSQCWSNIAPYSCSKFNEELIIGSSLDNVRYPEVVPFIVDIDNDNQVIACNRYNVNCYEYFGDNYGTRNFFRLKRGDNRLFFKCQVRATLEIDCYFLRKVGW